MANVEFSGVRRFMAQPPLQRRVRTHADANLVGRSEPNVRNYAPGRDGHVWVQKLGGTCCGNKARGFPPSGQSHGRPASSSTGVAR